MAAHNLGFALGRRGDVPAALAAFDRAEAAYASQGDPPRLVAALASDRCEVFLAVGLARDAAEAAERALAVLGDAGDATHHAEARLLLARARLAQGDLAAARAEAEAGGARLPRRRGGRRGRRWPTTWPCRPRSSRPRTSAAPPHGGMLGPHPADRPPSGGAGLAGRGHARAHLPGPGRPRPRTARRSLAGSWPTWSATAAAGRRCSASRRGTPPRCCGWPTTTEPAPSEPSAAGSRSSTSTGPRWAPPSCARGRPPTAPTSPASGFGWRWPTGGRRRCCDGPSGGGPAPCGCPPSRRPTTPALTPALQDLREARAELRDATLEGEPAPALAQRVTRLEAAVRGRTMRAGPGRRRRRRHRWTWPACATALGRRQPRRARSRSRGGSSPSRWSAGGRSCTTSPPSTRSPSKQGYLRAALRRLPRARAPEPPAPARPGARGHGGAARRPRCSAPLQLPDGPVVIVPTGALHGLSWGAPARAWRAGRSRCRRARSCWHRRGRRVGAGARRAGRRWWPAPTCRRRPRGPPPGAPTIRGRRRPARRAAPRRPTCTARWSGADLVHLAAHGTFRSDAPAVLLAAARRRAAHASTSSSGSAPAPDTLVLPACDAAVARGAAGRRAAGHRGRAARPGRGVAWWRRCCPCPDAAHHRR